MTKELLDTRDSNIGMSLFWWDKGNIGKAREAYNEAINANSLLGFDNDKFTRRAKRAAKVLKLNEAEWESAASKRF